MDKNSFFLNLNRQFEFKRSKSYFISCFFLKKEIQGISNLE